MQDRKHLLPTHLTVSEYAEKKGRTRASVYNHINNGGIVPDEVGTGKTLMIDWDKYCEYNIPEGRRPKQESHDTAKL
jgi:hypothetical protein